MRSGDSDGNWFCFRPSGDRLTHSFNEGLKRNMFLVENHTAGNIVMKNKTEEQKLYIV